MIDHGVGALGMAGVQVGSRRGVATGLERVLERRPSLSVIALSMSPCASYMIGLSISQARWIDRARVEFSMDHES